jgi:tetratricopeptide (TPR) repeat protein
LDVRSLAALVLALSLITVGMVPSQAHAAKAKASKEQKDPREMQAREAFAAGSYKEALDIYTKLYAEKLHPTYLRNIGRCYQKLKEPEKAIDTFRDYLNKAKNLAASEQKEIDGYIADMESLKERQAAEKAPAAPPPVAPAPKLQPAPPAPETQLIAEAPAPAPESPPFYKRGWFWGAAAGVVAAGVVGALWAAGVFSKSFDPCEGRPGCVPAAGGQ